jgi:hypothetical protein
MDQHPGHLNGNTFWSLSQKTSTEIEQFVQCTRFVKSGSFLILSSGIGSKEDKEDNMH